MMHRRPTSRRGQALVESALALLVFLPILFGIIDFGQYLYFQQTLTERARAAARVAVLDPSQVDRIKNVALYNSYTATGTPLLPSLTAAMISVSTADLGTPEGRVTIRISGYPIHFVTPGLARTMSAPVVTVTYPSEAPW
jgi:Flp pilus assembly protein TadG